MASYSSSVSGVPGSGRSLSSASSLSTVGSAGELEIGDPDRLVDVAEGVLGDQVVLRAAQ